MIDKEEARARLIAMAENTPKGVQRDALVMGATSLSEDIAIQWLEEHDKQIRADAINDCMQIVKHYSSALIGTYYYNLFIDKMEQLKEQK